MQHQTHIHRDHIVANRKNIHSKILQNHPFSYTQSRQTSKNPSLRIIHDGKIKEFYDSFRTTISGSITRPESKLTSRKQVINSQVSRRQVIRPETSKKNRRLKEDLREEKSEQKRSQSDLGEFEVQIRLNSRRKEREKENEFGKVASKLSAQFRSLFAD